MIPVAPVWRVAVLMGMAALSGYGLLTTADSDNTGVLLFAPALTTLSVWLTGPWIAATLGRLLIGRWHGPAALLAGRRLYENPDAPRRTSCDAVLAVFLGSVGMTLLPACHGPGHFPGEWTETVIIGVLVTAPAGWCAVATVMTSVFDRRHVFGALLAAGTPVRVLRRVVSMEVTVPALIAMWGAGGGGVVIGAVVLRLLGAEAVFGGWMAAPAFLGSGAAVVATAACTPTLRRIGSGTQSWPYGHQ
ncbi:hypothetical protein FHX42_004703 [Saccharopolyspora lacisalsi]|uniref:Uncharacterized protein n=1 Tax=Halosaccharopolyspora lacisalsi TaxID=1000566 RepID=A0A839E377_9PSEU|nr:hypothetical protein [Halosaccharopolyspora lacisalsi]MBA8827319.1 hypothetical protein [Halosaccharopolyspora lacisalsi]